VEPEEIMRFNRLAEMLRKGRRARSSEDATPAAPLHVPFFEPLEGRTLLSGRGFAAYYFTGTDFAQLKTRREDPAINFDWGAGGDSAVTPGGFGAHYSGRVMPKFSETYHFYTRTTGGVRVWVNDQLLIDDWNTHALKDNVGSISLRAGVRYDVRIEYFDTTSAPRFELHWRSKRQAREVVPTGRLFASVFDDAPPAAATKLKATYVTDTAYKFIWSAATDDMPGTIVYDVYSARTRMGATTETYFTRGSRNPLNNYALTVRAVDWAGNVTVSAPLLITTKAFVGAGNGTGLAGRYYDSFDFTDLRMLRTDAQVLFGWEGNPFDGGADRDFSVRWEGSVLARYEELYSFGFLTEGAAKVWIGGTLVIDQPDANAPRELTHAMKLRAGRRYSVRIEYQHSAGQDDAMAALSWSSLSTRKQVVPVEQLDPAFTDAAAPTAPSNLRVDNATQNALSFSWDASTDDFGVAHYDVFRNGQKIASTSNTNYTDANLAPDTTYDYHVVAIDVAGKASANSATLAARTLAPPPIRSAFGVIAATSYNGSAGVSVSGNVITSLDDDDWVRYERIDFGGGGVRSLQMRLGASVAGAGGTIEVRLGARDGQLIGRHVVQPTGSYGTRYTQRFSVDGVSGLHDVYLVFRNRDNVANVESFQFSTQRLVRVMPLGDSITDGQAGRNSYRYFLYRKLVDAGLGVDFVGGRIRNDVGDPPNFNFDQNHEGHSGNRADQILANVVTWVQDHDPEVVLLHIGTNDIWQGQSVAGTVNEVAQIIDAIRSVNSSIRIVLAQIIPLAGFEPLIADFNGQLATMAAAKVAAGANLGVVDMHAGFSLSGDTDDGVHPNNSGAGKMADRWFDEIDDLLG
jgi:lysophospholipase L1-like esterase